MFFSFKNNGEDLFVNYRLSIFEEDDNEYHILYANIWNNTSFNK